VVLVGNSNSINVYVYSSSSKSMDFVDEEQSDSDWKLPKKVIDFNYKLNINPI